MKRFKTIFMTAACILSLAACGSAKPDLKEIEKAISEGNVTIDDALKKGWITQEWVDNYVQNNSVPADDKVGTNAIDNFTTQTLAGSTFAKDNISGVTFLSFIDPSAEEGKNFYKELTTAYEQVKESGAEIIVCVRGKEGHDLFENAPFPVILYNEELQTALGENAEMAEASSAAGIWYIDGSLLSAWCANISADDLKESASYYVQNYKNTNSESRVPKENTSDGENAVSTIGD